MQRTVPPAPATPSRVRPGLALALLAAGLAAADARSALGAGEPEPLWAYGYATPPGPADPAPPETVPPTSRTPRDGEPAESQTRLRHVPGSLAAFSELDIRDGGRVVDWFPGDHPPMGRVLERGPARLGEHSWGCAYCHLPTGKGRPENAPVVGQPVAYFMRQLADFRAGARTSADPRKPNTRLMAGLSRLMTDAEMREAAEYFGAMKWTPWTRVVETDRVPRTRIEGNLFRAVERERIEPIAGRIIEVPEDPEQSEGLRNPRSGFIAYVPKGSVRRGEFLVTTGGATIEGGKAVPGKTLACAACHGPDLMGLLDVPGIAGRSPSYLVRQLYDLQQGTRRGASAAPMLPVVARLTGDDLVDIAAYVTSRSAPVATQAP